MSNKKITILGATGSVGKQALDVARKQNYMVEAVSCNSDIQNIEAAVREFGVKLCAVENESAANQLKAALRDTDCKVIGGKGASEKLASETKADTVLNSITGMAGLKPTVSALKSGKDLALANKESLVTAGSYVMKLAKEQNKEILPVDSEHCAIWQSLRGGKRSEVKKLILTASGGPFFGYTKEQIQTVTAEQALKHPTWNMGSKITIDSATLMNKGFEVIEAAWLFGVDAEKIDVIVHRESIIHSMVEYKDNTVIAQLGVPDMRACIQYALTYPLREEAVVNELDLVSLAKMTFFAPDTETFPLLALAKKVWTLGGTYGSALNGANEEAVGAFLQGRIGLPKLFALVEEATLKTGIADDSFDAVLATDSEARRYVRQRL